MPDNNKGIKQLWGYDLIDSKARNAISSTRSSLENDFQKKTDDTLGTTSKTIPGAINEIKDSVDNLDGKFSVEQTDTKYDMKYNGKTIANIALTLSDDQIAGGDGSFNIDLSPYQTKTDTSLTTTNKTISGAINEVNTQCKDIVKKIDSGNIGTVVSNTIEPQLMDIPRIYFSEGTLPTTKTATVMKFDYYSKSTEHHGWVEIKCQGNSSMSYPKKNFTIKIFKEQEKINKLKIDFKGWGKQSKFVLKANWIDITHARNVVSARIWGDVIKTRSDYATAISELLRTSPNQGAIDGFPVLVYSNGVYQGRYTLNIPKDKWMSNMDDALDTHCILCGENYQSGCFRALPDINGNDWTDELHDVVPASIKTSWTNAINFVMTSSDSEFKTNLSNYFDVNSLIDYYLYGLVSTNLDGFGKNQLFFSYDGIHWIASVYDLDSTWGLYWNGSKILPTDYRRNQYEDYVNSTGNLLYNRLEQLFISQLKARYTELRKDVLSASHIIQKFEEFNQLCPKDIVQEDYASTTGGGKFTGIPSTTTNNIQQLRTNIVARLVYVDSYVNALQEAEAIPCTNITLNKTELAITQAGTSTSKEETINTTYEVGYINRNQSSFNSGISGTIKTDSADDRTTDFIDISNFSSITYTIPTRTYIGAVTYDNNKKYLKAYDRTGWVDYIATDYMNTILNITSFPENAKYIRFTSNTPNTTNNVIKAIISVNTGQEKLIPTLTPTNTTDTVVWSVNPTGICTVKNGVITPIKNGECAVTATCGAQSATCNITVNLPNVACTGIVLDKDTLSLGSFEEESVDSSINLLEDATWQDGNINNNGSISEGSDKYTTVTINVPGVYKLNQSGGYTYTKIIDQPTVVGHPYGLSDPDGSDIIVNVFDVPRTFYVSVFPNEQIWNPSSITLKYQSSIKENCTLLDNEQQITDPNLINIRWTDNDYTYVEIYSNSIITQNKLVVKFNNVNYRITTTKKQPMQSSTDITNLALDNYTLFNEWDNKTLFFFRLPIAWGSTKEEIMNYMTTNNINKLVINPSDYINSLPVTGTVTKLTAQLIPTLTPTDTTDTVVWSANPTGICTVENGVVTAKSNGQCTITATCGSQSTTCNVTVSGISTPPSSVLYTLPQETTFNGTSDYVDTGVQLFKTDQDFTITLDVTADTPIAIQTCIIHCMKEQSPYPGIALQSSGNDGYFALSAANNVSVIRNLVDIPQRTKLVIVKNGTTMKAYNSNNIKAQSAYNFTSIDQTLLLGAYQDINGTKGRFFKGTIHEFTITNTVYTDEQINAYLGKVSQGRLFKIDSTCMNITDNKLTDSIGGIEATLVGTPTVNNNQIAFTENDTFKFDMSSLNLTSKNRTFRIKFTPTSLDNRNACMCVIGQSVTDWNKLTSIYISDSIIRIQHGGTGSITDNTVGSTSGGSGDNRLPNGEAPSINTEYEIVISENGNTNEIRWFINGTLVQNGTTPLYNPLVLANSEGNNRFVGSYSLIEIYDVFCDTYNDFTDIAE